MAMEGLILMIGILSLAIILLFLAIKISLEDKGVLNVLLLIFALILFILVPKVAMDYDEHCEIQPTNQTVSGNVTSYSYDYICFENGKSTSSVFYRTIIRLSYILAFYAFMYGLYKLYAHIKDRTKW